MTIWTLRKLPENATNAARIEARCDTGEKPLVTQNIAFTDFPLDTIDLWLCDGVDRKSVV